MRQKVENEIWRLNAYLYDVVSTMEFYYLRTTWYMYVQSVTERPYLNDHCMYIV